MVFKREQMALLAHGHIIEEPGEDYSGTEIKQGWEKETIFIKKDEVTARKQSGRTEQGGERQNMFGKCSTTCLEFIINFLEPSPSDGSGAHASGAIPFHGQM